MSRTYNDYCPVAHALEAIGDRWSLIIVRDLLLLGPQRFSDLQQYSSSITPKWLMLRLRQLEESGVVERNNGKDRREVWYRLTPAGEELSPVIEALAGWGLRHKMGPPRPGETIHPESSISILANSLNRRHKVPSRSSTWLLDFKPGGPLYLSFDGERWSCSRENGAKPDVTVKTSPENWVTFMSLRGSERTHMAQSLQVKGRPERVSEFFSLLGVRDISSN